jgi:nitronate monooxygenase
MLGQSIHAAGLDPALLDETVTPSAAAELYGRDGAGPHRWSQVWSAGHSVSGVRALVSVAELVEQTEKDYREAT